MHQLYIFSALLKAKVENKVFVKLDSKYAEYFPEYSGYFGRTLRLLKSMHVMTNSGKLFPDELTDWFIEEGLIQYQWHIYIYIL